MSKFTHTCKRASLVVVVALISSGFLAVHDIAVAQNEDPLKVLMITGGGPYHDYFTQKRQLEEGLSERIGNIEFTIDHNEGESKEDMHFKFESQLNDEWAQKFDLVLYNNCNLDMGDAEHVERIMNAHAEH
ncbi:MAG: hypothetical protein RLN96_06175, partial [Pseudomonadales bacterium]